MVLEGDDPQRQVGIEFMTGGGSQAPVALSVADAGALIGLLQQAVDARKTAAGGE